jgi:hypothetical protein
MTFFRRPPFLNDGQIPARPDAPLNDSALFLYDQVTTDPLNEAYLAGKSAAAAKGTTANKNRPELLALPPAIVAVCARHKPPLKPIASEEFAELIRDEVRREVYAAVEPKIKKRLQSRRPEYPSAGTIARTIGRMIRDFPKDSGKT